MSMEKFLSKYRKLVWLLLFIFILILGNNNLIYTVKAGCVGSMPQESDWKFSVLCANKTHVNYSRDPICSTSPSNGMCDGRCIYYCPTYAFNGIPIYARIKITEDAILTKIRAPLYAGSKYTCSDKLLVSLKYGSYTFERHVSESDPVAYGQYRDIVLPQPLQLTAGTTLSFRVVDYDKEAGYHKDRGSMGFRFPYKDSNGRLFCGETYLRSSGNAKGECPPPKIRCDMCGGTRQCPFTGKMYLDNLMQTSDPSEQVLYPLCFADIPIGLSDFDFNDFAVMLIGGPACTCQETTCTPPAGDPKTACREKYDDTYSASCTYTCCDSPNDCTPGVCTNTTTGTYVNNSSSCSVSAPTNIRYSVAKNGHLDVRMDDRGDLLRLTAFSYSPSACLAITKKGSNSSFPGTLPITYRNMDCSSSGYNRPKSYRTDLTFRAKGGQDLSGYLNNNTCVVNINAEVLAEGPANERSLSQCSDQVSIYYPPTIPLYVRIYDKNKSSIAGLDGSYPSKLVEDSTVDWVGTIRKGGGTGEDPFQLLQSPNPDTFVTDGVCSVRGGGQFVYKRGDNNPMNIVVDLWDENKANDFVYGKQEIFLVHEASGRKYPINRDPLHNVSTYVLGLTNRNTAVQSLNTGSMSGFGKYPITQSFAGSFESCMNNSANIYCTSRFKVDSIPSVIIKNYLNSIRSSDSRYKYIKDMPASIRNNPPSGVRLWIRFYQQSLPNGKYHVEVATKDKEGATASYSFPNANFTVDNTLPDASIDLIACGEGGNCKVNGRVVGGDIMQVHIEVQDNNVLPSNYAFFVPFVFAENTKDGSKRFLPIWNYRNRKVTSYKLDGTLYGTVYPNGTNIASYFFNVKKTNGGKNESFDIFVAGVRSGDNLHYGVCAYDVAGNIKCTWNNLCEGGHESTVGNNWIKTSLDNVYSKGGFSDLPRYNEITGVVEYPHPSLQSFFNNYLHPFHTDVATLSTFAVVTNNSDSLNNIQWGYNGHLNPLSFSLKNRNIYNATFWYTDLKSLAKDRCELLNSCEEININTQGDPVQAFKNALADSHKYKIIEVHKNLSIPSNTILRCKNANLIFVESGTINLKNMVIKSKFNPNSSSSNPFYINDEGCLFVLAPSSSAKMIIDDDPTVQGKIKNVRLQHDPSTGYGVDADFAQFGVISLDSNANWDNPQVWIKQTPRDAYRHADGYYDAFILQGFIYSLGLPRFDRDLVYSANAKFPSEWIIYDPSLLNVFEPLLGKYKVQTFKCGVNQHPWCKE